MDTLTSAPPQVHAESLLGTSQGHLCHSPACLSKVSWKTMLWKSPSEGARGCVPTYSLPLPKVLADCITLPLSTAEEVHTHTLHLGTCVAGLMWQNGLAHRELAGGVGRKQFCWSLTCPRSSHEKTGRC